MSTTEQLSEDQRAVRAGAGLVDRSERGKLALTGAETKRFLQGQITNDALALAPGDGIYAAFLTAKGKMLGDLRVLDAGDELLLDTERVALQELFNMIRRYSLGFDVELHRRTIERGLLSLVGPRAREIAGADGLAAQEHANAAADVDGIPVRLIATDLGVDLWVDSAQTEALKQALVARGALPVAEQAAEIVRVEQGRPRYGVDLDDATIPQEAGLNERAVSFTKGCYVGQETVARLFYKGKPNRHLRGLRLSQPLPSGTELTLDGKRVGALGSVVESPLHGPIALALVRREAQPGTIVQAGTATAEVVELPF
ncbi:folate-binding protein [Conexibacter sp. JD483]|uniref:CAF17-like 4Fe-4S cluster assembly/insertion protein YgfZ n=1 Tax=unclassified Conexibacter TaxID=2627773 RepID=UPI00271E295D|nr:MULTISPECIES: folate-binding protein [unclassified Conexibacter]MDO8187166.1 folate-binding protein [Conexibacter sp. CPCC 205706]MDO8200342.1 folate-binding protein [Conexibacter sp. CPCC 205762]MDR9368862.1 folate-binding protein [Conexibacter sp. JD483]